MTALFYTLGVIFALMCVFLMLLILIQKGRGGGLSSAFGGAGGNTAFGTKTGDVLTWATSVVFVLFLLLGMGLVWTGKSLKANVGGPAPIAAPDEDGEVDDAPTGLGDMTDTEPTDTGESTGDVPAEVENIPAESE
ncbi:MAG: preprotein translocase subunit SecG [Planctomycetota bacterium]